MGRLNRISLVLVAAVTAQAHAGFMGKAMKIDEPALGLERWQVDIWGTPEEVGGEAENVVTISKLVITGAVHQVWQTGSQNGTRTVDDIGAAGVLFIPDWNVFDTHLLVSDEEPNDQIVSTLGRIVESNDGSDPARLQLPGPFPGTEPSVGLGEWAMIEVGDDAGAFALEPEFQLPHLKLMQVVIPAGLGPQVTATLDVFGNFNRDDPIALVIPLPEPTTGLMMAVGCLALSRRRRPA